MQFQDVALGALAGFIVGAICTALGFLALRPKPGTVGVEPYMLMIRKGRFIAVTITNRSATPTAVTSAIFYLDGNQSQRISLQRVERQPDGRTEFKMFGPQYRLLPGDAVDGCVVLDDYYLDDATLEKLHEAKRGWVEVEHTMSASPIKADVDDFFDLFIKWRSAAKATKPNIFGDEIPF